MKHKYIILLILLFFVLPANLGAQEKAYPKNGEGIELFLKRFNRTGSYYQKEFIRLNSSIKGGRTAGEIRIDFETSQRI